MSIIQDLCQKASLLEAWGTRMFTPTVVPQNRTAKEQQFNKKQQLRAGGVPPWVECLSARQEALSSTPHTPTVVTHLSPQHVGREDKNDGPKSPLEHRKIEKTWLCDTLFQEGRKEIVVEISYKWDIAWQGSGALQSEHRRLQRHQICPIKQSRGRLGRCLVSKQSHACWSSMRT